MNRRLRAWNVLVIALLLAACNKRTPSLTSLPTPYVVSTRLMADLKGTLVLEHGCLMVGTYSLVWPPDFRTEVNGDSVQITDTLLDRQITWQVGQEVILAGGEVPLLSLDETMRQQVSDCQEPYWVFGGWREITPTP